MVETAQHLVGLIEEHQFSNTYWAYYGDIADYPYFQEAIIRPFPQEVSGTLKSYDYNPATGEFTMTWEEEAAIKAPTMIYLPWLSCVNEDIRIVPEFEKLETEQINGSDAGWLMVPPTGKGGTREMTIQFSRQDKKDYLILEQ